MADDIALVVAIAAGVVAIVALGVAIWLATELRRVRAAQRVLLPSGATEDVVGRQAELARAVASVEEQLSSVAGQVQQNRHAADARLAESLQLRGLVRYDAYSEMGGHQSWSVALLDERGTGAVISCLHARDHARIYLKEIVSGQADQRLSPEEQRAIGGGLGVSGDEVGGGVQVDQEAGAGPRAA